MSGDFPLLCEKLSKLRNCINYLLVFIPAVSWSKRSSRIIGKKCNSLLELASPNIPGVLLAETGGFFYPSSSNSCWQSVTLCLFFLVIWAIHWEMLSGRLWLYPLPLLEDIVSWGRKPIQWRYMEDLSNMFLLPLFGPRLSKTFSMTLCNLVFGPLFSSAFIFQTSEEVINILKQNQIDFAVYICSAYLADLISAHVVMQIAVHLLVYRRPTYIVMGGTYQLLRSGTSFQFVHIARLEMA